MAMNLASKYSSKVDERFSVKSLTDAAVNKDYEWSGVSTITVYGVDTSPLNDYSRTGTSRYGTPSELGNTKQDMALTQDKSFTYTIDKGNKEESMGVMEAGKSLAREIDEVILPTIDAYRLRTMGIGATDNSHFAAAAVANTTAAPPSNAANLFRIPISAASSSFSSP
jgi:hypothetical protein